MGRQTLGSMAGTACRRHASQDLAPGLSGRRSHFHHIFLLPAQLMDGRVDLEKVSVVVVSAATEGTDKLSLKHIEEGAQNLLDGQVGERVLLICCIKCVRGNALHGFFLPKQEKSCLTHCCPHVHSPHPTPHPAPHPQNSQRHVLLEYRCTRYFFSDTANTFLPVPPIPRAFNEQLQRSAVHVASGGGVADLPAALEWDLGERLLR